MKIQSSMRKFDSVAVFVWPKEILVFQVKHHEHIVGPRKVDSEQSDIIESASNLIEASR